MFQQSVNVNPALAVAGDFATINPRRSAIPAPGGATGAGYMAGPAGLTVGRFAWADTATNTILANTGTGVPTGFCHRNLQAMIGLYLGRSSMLVPAGMGFGDLFSGGDFFAKNDGSGAVAIGMKAFASLADGTIQFGAPAAVIALFIETKWYAAMACLAGELTIITDSAP